MNLNTIHHIAIICSDKDTAQHFYHELLGFPVIRSNYRQSGMTGRSTYASTTRQNWNCSI